MPSRTCIIVIPEMLVASASTQKQNMLAGCYVGKDDPVLIVQCRGTFPAVGEVLEAFVGINIVEGWMRGSYNGPLLPVAFGSARCTRFDGPQRCIAGGLQLAGGMLAGPVDMFDDVAFGPAPEMALQGGRYTAQHGAFRPHRLPLDEMEYTTMSEVTKRMKMRFEPIVGD